MQYRAVGSAVRAICTCTCWDASGPMIEALARPGSSPPVGAAGGPHRVTEPCLYALRAIRFCCRSMVQRLVRGSVDSSAVGIFVMFAQRLTNIWPASGAAHPAVSLAAAWRTSATFADCYERDRARRGGCWGVCMLAGLVGVHATWRVILCANVFFCCHRDPTEMDPIWSKNPVLGTFHARI